MIFDFLFVDQFLNVFNAFNILLKRDDNKLNIFNDYLSSFSATLFVLSKSTKNKLAKEIENLFERKSFDNNN